MNIFKLNKFTCVCRGGGDLGREEGSKKKKIRRRKTRQLLGGGAKLSCLLQGLAAHTSLRPPSRPSAHLLRGVINRA